METWEHATLGWYVDGRQIRHFWRIAGQEPMALEGSPGLLARLGDAGAEGWELVAVTASEIRGENLYFKRRSSGS